MTYITKFEICLCLTKIKKLRNFFFPSARRLITLERTSKLLLINLVSPSDLTYSSSVLLSDPSKSTKFNTADKICGLSLLI